MTPEDIRRKLLAQHDLLRSNLATCMQLASRFREGEAVAADLDISLDLLRHAFAEHNETEQTVISRLIGASDTRGARLLDRMTEEHLAEHAAFWELLSGSRAQVVARIHDLAEELDAHMAAEERTFLSPTAIHPERHRIPSG